jgi:hypothetical protein
MVHDHQRKNLFLASVRFGPHERHAANGPMFAPSLSQSMECQVTNAGRTGPRVGLHQMAGFPAVWLVSV